MTDWKERVERAQRGDLAAFDELVRKFRDMAVGYAYTVLNDFYLSEDVAQEAFVRAYLDIQSLREPGAFPSWLRRIVFKYCDRYLRKQRVLLRPLDAALDIASPGKNPHDEAARREEHDRVMSSIDALPDSERTATTLFYINGYSMAEVGEFLEVPVTQTEVDGNDERFAETACTGRRLQREGQRRAGRGASCELHASPERKNGRAPAMPGVFPLSRMHEIKPRVHG